ncbi:hypothetical protein DK293_05880 [Vibrio cholerae]|nr:hypothetical protein [Vibrio cholerae]
MLVNKKRVLQYTQSLASGEPVMSKVCNSHRTRWEKRIKNALSIQGFHHHRVSLAVQHLA